MNAIVRRAKYSDGTLWRRDERGKTHQLRKTERRHSAGSVVVVIDEYLNSMETVKTVRLWFRRREGRKSRCLGLRVAK